MKRKTIEIKNNKARHTLSNVRYRQMAFRLVDGAVVGSFFGRPWSNKSNAQPPEGDYMKFVLICLNVLMLDYHSMVTD